MTEAELVLTRFLQCDRASLYLMRDSVPAGDVSAALAQALRRRISGEPLQYILGEAEFMGLRFKLTPACLIPRPETEILVETAIQYGGRQKVEGRRIEVLDVGTGSGCIAVSLANMLDNVSVTAIDVSPEALSIARENAHYHRVEGKIDFICSDFFSFRLPPSAFRLFDIIVSNPPYIPSARIDTLQIEVRREPRRALDGGADGLDFYRALGRAAAGSLLRPGGLLLVEIGWGQLEAVRNIFQNSRKFEIIEVVKDYSGIDRVVVMKSTKHK